jgi:hypothetical protein
VSDKRSERRASTKGTQQFSDEFELKFGHRRKSYSTRTCSMWPVRGAGGLSSRPRHSCTGSEPGGKRSLITRGSFYPSRGTSSSRCDSAACTLLNGITEVVTPR